MYCFQISRSVSHKKILVVFPRLTKEGCDRVNHATESQFLSAITLAGQTVQTSCYQIEVSVAYGCRPAFLFDVSTNTHGEGIIC